MHADESKAIEDEEENKAALAAASDLDYFRLKRGTLRDGDGSGEEFLHTDTEDEAADGNAGDAADVDVGETADVDVDEAADGNVDEAADGELGVGGDARKVGSGGEVADEASVAETGRLFVRNLPYTCTEEELAQVFQRLGPLTEVHLPLDKETKRPLGFAHVVYMIPEHAVRALEDLDGSIFQVCAARKVMTLCVVGDDHTCHAGTVQGRLMHVLPGRAKVDAKGKESTAGRTFKERRAAEKKAQAEAEHTWNTLFMRVCGA